MADPPAVSRHLKLSSGQAVHIRAVRPDDAKRLIALFARLSPESIYYRFLEARKELTLAQAQAFATVDYDREMALVAILLEDGDERLIGIARYAACEPPDHAVAEAAIVVEDAFQSQGLGTELLRELVQFALQHGVKTFAATVHQSNARILHFIEKSGYPTRKRLESGAWEVRVDLSSTSPSAQG